MTFDKKVLDRCKNYKTVFIFVSKYDEVNTHNIINELLKIGKRVVVPICDTGKHNIILSEIKKFDLSKSTFGILEPICVMPVNKKDIDIFFVPGTLFDKNGNRKGRGKGYFDRFLKNVDKPIIGLCYRCQLVNKIKRKRWDVSVDEVIVR